MMVLTQVNLKERYSIGQGLFESVVGVKYEGQWKDGEMEGYGVMTFANVGCQGDGVSGGRGCRHTGAEGTSGCVFEVNMIFAKFGYFGNLPD